MSAVNFQSANQTFRQLLGNGLSYRVPRFQRDYSWTEDEWEDLWEDMLGTLAEGGEPAHYMGYLVLQTGDSKTFNIIDGQQRMTTLSLLVLAVLKNFKELIEAGEEPEPNQRRLEHLRGTYLGYVDPVTLVSRSKLTLNRNNDLFYQNYLVPLQRVPQRGLKSSEHALRKGFEWFVEKLRQHYRGRRTGAALAEFIDRLADKLFFTVITVTDELNAFKVFETLNARGVRLSATDLLKNHLFMVVHRAGTHDAELVALEQRWERIVGQLGSESFPDFLRVHWSSRRALVRQADLFKTIRVEIRERGQVFDLLRAMEEDAEVYAALFRPEDEFWTGEQRESVRALDLFRVRQPFALLIAARRRLVAEDFNRVLEATVVISFRYNAIGNFATNEQERIYAQAAARLARPEPVEVGQVLADLRPVYIGDEQFRELFATKVLRTTQTRNKRLARYILFAIERHVCGAVFEAESDRYSIEHILPESAGADWGPFNEEEIDDFLYRLGNLALLDAPTNRALGNSAYAEKAGKYRESEFATTQKVAADYADWTPERITHRQRWMANQATSIWRVSQFD
jgi:hypothetical protein